MLRPIPFLALRAFSSSCRSLAEFSHVVIGGGVVGTAIGSELQAVAGNNVLLVEQHSHLATETTSRNSEVIHAGLYYPKDSLKGKLCIRGKNKIYQAAETGKFQVDFLKCGKWVVAQDESEAAYLEKLAKNSAENGVPVSFVSPSQARARLPLIRAEYGALESPTTGIISAHDYTVFFQGQFENNGGTIGVNSTLVGVQFDRGTSSYTLGLQDESGEQFEITADNLVNAAGLHAPRVSNMLLPPERHLRSYFAKGTYFSYEGKSKITDKLIYPCPNPNASSLGTHLTFDLGGQLKFGPDLEWLDIENASEIDYTPSAGNLEAAYEAVERYFPRVREGRLVASYSGVRPKIFSAADNKKKFADFIIREEEGFPGFVNLIGIESPGLTASWAIGEYVRDIYHL
ncbi:FAD dependent oxidoreductase [Suhomyces tanzawaensis NRRL Y-17324]|uniref:L-2-hydroxyglutarate dehydrogenase, mitochondrial n=1 Tax=Suhomyces tanzawaensis NRRL Y-17324 TaxID=984487 RepID=A0A1E4SGY8_9ASCO|nr:FAD dependent oxidoreductase [Suhomyces tanzawaensis NRRL Y-17324]ODV78768.1 FAD dependent oxidoreductase [Suhomyces tanzawaensis NRRL Y-17324]